MINGAHVIIYSTNADADRDFFKDVLGLPGVDVGGGWLIFGLPPSEVAVHPSEGDQSHELYLMCEDIQAFVAAVAGRGLGCSPVENQGWGLVTELSLPGGGKLGVYQPRHARPPAPGAGKAKPAARKPAKKPTKKPTKQTTKKPPTKPAAKNTKRRRR
jgi:catechol 2,3-dioxygenase-like lactoylglutathione lyase family enzyme